MRENLTADPYRILGRELRTLRNKASETLAETSAAVEISSKDLIQFELGKTRPSEEVLLLLISHFQLHDNLALKIWKLAGYGMDNTESATAIYTDNIELNVGKLGVTLEFSQSNAVGAKTPVAKVGMSKEHAEVLLKSLMIALNKIDPQKRRIILPSDQDELPR